MSGPTCHNPTACESRGWRGAIYCRRCWLKHNIALKTQRFVASLGIHESELADYRFWRSQHYSRDEAVRIILSARQVMAA